MTLGKLPWVREMDVWRGLPKTARIPTGGWRGIGSVPSHSYPYESTLPGGYWQGMGLVASVASPAAQRVKTFSGFGVTTTATATTAADYRLLAAKARDAGKLTEAAYYESKAKELEAAASSGAWSDALKAIMTAGATAYSASQQFSIQRDLIKAGVQTAPMQLAPTAAAPAGGAPPVGGGAGGMPTGLLLAAAAGIGLLMFLRR